VNILGRKLSISGSCGPIESLRGVSLIKLCGSIGRKLGLSVRGGLIVPGTGEETHRLLLIAPIQHIKHTNDMKTIIIHVRKNAESFNEVSLH